MNIARMMRSAWRYAVEPEYRFLFDASRGKYNALSDEEYLRRKYKAIFGRELDWQNPKTFNEKLQWLKLNNRTPEQTMMVDKYRVRDYIAQTLGEEYLIPLLGVWDAPGEIDFDALPDRFLLKCNHNSGLGMCICKEKAKLDVGEVRKELRRGLNEDYYIRHREWPYKNVPRKIICEQYMEDDSGNGLRDFKVHCFNGEPKFILVCSDRFSEEGLREDFYDVSWNRMDLRRPTHPNSQSGVQKPEQLKEMLTCAKKLAKDFPFVRIDFYIIHSRMYFGEITFFPASGFEKFVPEQWDTILGAWISLPDQQTKTAIQIPSGMMEDK